MTARRDGHNPLKTMKPCTLATLLLCAPVALAQIPDPFGNPASPPVESHVTGYTVFGNAYEVHHSDGRISSGIISGDSSSPIQVVCPDNGGGGFIFNGGNGYSRYFGN